MTTNRSALQRPAGEQRRGNPRHSQSERAAALLAELAAEAEPGNRLGSKAELRVVCGVSVGTFNEALRMIQARGLVTSRSGPGGGLFASHQSAMVRLGNTMLSLDGQEASVAEAVRLRDVLDPLLVEDALEHMSAHGVAALRKALGKMKVAAEEGDNTAFLRANWALHARIAESSPSAILSSVYLNLLEIIESHLLAVRPYADEPLRQYIHDRYELHAALVEAIAARDPKALSLIREHNTTKFPTDNPRSAVPATS